MLNDSIILDDDVHAILPEVEGKLRGGGNAVNATKTSFEHRAVILIARTAVNPAGDSLDYDSYV